MSDELNMSSVTADPAPETAGKRAAPEEKPPKTPGKRAGLIIGIAAAVLVLAAVVFLVWRLCFHHPESGKAHFPGFPHGLRGRLRHPHPV